MIKRLSKELNEFRMLLREMPATSMVFFTLSIVFMNLLANKELVNTSWLALDCGFTISWISFLSMDMIVKRFGAKASIELSLFAEFINLFFSGILFLIASLSSNWGEYYTYGESIINSALDSTIGGTWYVVLGSTLAFIVSAIINSVLNQSIGKSLHRDNFKSYAIRSYVSTFIGQFVDNLIFAYVVCINFFGWTHLQCWVCALTGAIFELLAEVIFSPLGYGVYKQWTADDVGRKYLNGRKRK